MTLPMHLSGITGITGMRLGITGMVKDITGMMGLMGITWDDDRDDWDNKDGNLASSTGVLREDSAPSRFGLKFQPPAQAEASILVTLLSCK